MGSHFSQIEAELHEVQLLISKLGGIEKIPRIEIDLALTKLQNVYDFLLHKSNSLRETQIEKVQPDETIKTIKETLKAENEINISDGHENKINPLSAKPDDELIFIDDKKVEIETKIDTDKENSDNSKLKELNHPGHERHKGKEILAEKYNKNQQFINEKLAQGIHKKDISGQMQLKALKNIEAAIGVNEKFLFVRELFNGDTETFHKTIRILNNVANFNEAFNYIHSTFNWNLENAAAQKLLELVRRRFIIDEE
jgi:hypothetical protein